MTNDSDHLKFLSIGFYIYAGWSALIGCLPLVHVGMGIMIVLGTFDSDGNPPPPFFGWLFIGFGSLFVLFGWATAIASLLAGRFLVQRKNYTFIMVTSAILCLFAPIGTVLGVFAIVVLVRDSVKELFGKVQPKFDGPAPDWR